MSALVKSLMKAAAAHQAALHDHPPAPLNELRSLASNLFFTATALAPATEDELTKCWNLLAAWLEDSTASPGKLPLEVWRRVPEMLWMLHGEQPVVASLRLRQGLSWAASLSVPRAPWTLRLARAYVTSAGAPTESRQWLGEILRRWCGMEDHASLTRWRQRDQRFQLWSPGDFPGIFAKLLFEAPLLTLRELFEEAGMASAAALTGDLSREAFQQWLEIPRNTARGYKERHLSLVREWTPLLVSEAAWPRALSVAVINGLLEPWSQLNPAEPAFQREILAVLKKWFGADFIKREGVSDLSRGILQRWQVLDVMEGYFEEVKTYAEGFSLMSRHWKHRRQFWLAYYRTGKVSLARALIGKGMMMELGEKTLRAKFGPAMAEFASLDKNHCGLLLEINGLTVIDLSHNGRAYFFLHSNRYPPRRNQAVFARRELELTADAAMVHAGPDTYTWQRNFAEYISHHTGVRIPESSYRIPP